MERGRESGRGWQPERESDSEGETERVRQRGRERAREGRRGIGKEREGIDRPKPRTTHQRFHDTDLKPRTGSGLALFKCYEFT